MTAGSVHVKIDGSLLQGLMLQNIYTELHSGSKNVTVVVRNIMAYPTDSEEEDPSGDRAVAWSLGY